MRSGGKVLTTRFIRLALLLCCALSLTASCTTPPEPGDDLLTGTTSRSNSRQSDDTRQTPASDLIGTLATGSHNRERRRGGVERGTGKFLNNPTDAQRAPRSQRQHAEVGKEGVTLNLVGVDIAQAAKSVLGDLLSLNYLIDPAVSGQITVQTTNPVPLPTLADIFDAALRANGAAIVDDGSGVFKVVPSAQATASMPSLRIDAADIRRRTIGVGIQVVPLKYVSVSEMERVLQPIAPQGALLYADEARNIMMLTGTRKELSALLETIEVFDVDWMKGMSFALVPLRTSDPEAISNELETVFSSGSQGGANRIVRFVPNKRLRSILIITSRPHYLDKARRWIKRLDAAAAGAERQLFVYNVQNRTAAELAVLLQQVFAAGGGLQVSTTVAPRFQEAEVTSSGDDDNGAAPAVQPVAPQANTGENAGGVHVVADESNNALLVFATPQDYRRVLKMLEQLDTIQNQVLLEATIAEVSLNDELKFGLRWFFESGKASYTFTDAVAGAVSSVFPGFSYVFNASDARVVLNAVSGVTDVNIISSPSLMVLDNKTAVLQVGDQVPVATQSAVSVADPDAPIVNAIEFKDTGVILSVTPRVNDSGRVILEIEQEVSDVVNTTTSGIDSPTIQQRKVKTTVVVNDGESLALGGLMQKRHEDTRTKVPVLGDIPVLGTMFRQKTDDQERTELLILITPRVVRDLREARRVTDEFRRRLNVTVPRIRPGRQAPEDEARRILE